MTNSLIYRYRTELQGYNATISLCYKNTHTHIYTPSWGWNVRTKLLVKKFVTICGDPVTQAGAHEFTTLCTQFIKEKRF